MNKLQVVFGIDALCFLIMHHTYIQIVHNAQVFFFLSVCCWIKFSIIHLHKMQKAWITVTKCVYVQWWALLQKIVYPYCMYDRSFFLSLPIPILILLLFCTQAQFKVSKRSCAGELKREIHYINTTTEKKKNNNMMNRAVFSLFVRLFFFFHSWNHLLKNKILYFFLLFTQNGNWPWLNHWTRTFM